MSIERERHDNVLLLTINRPAQGNSLDMECMQDIGDALAEARDDDGIRCIVLTGVGNRAFCSGMDMKSFATGGIDFESGVTGLEIFTQKIYPKPIVAAVNGTAVGGGFELMLACDLAVAADHAKFGLTEVRFGFVAAGGGTRLPRRIPLAIALEMGLTGSTVDARRVLELGLVNRVVPGPQVVGETLALATRIAANGPMALRVTKQLMMEEIGEGPWARIRESCNPVFRSEDAREGALAFAEKRTPVWKNR
jgi:enoyl-CoA hydratase